MWYMATVVLASAFVMTTYDPLKGKMCGDAKHYPAHSKPERFKETRFFFQSL